jgi:multidrug efflux pump subunit AcrA (membrane-fusion protein)
MSTEVLTSVPGNIWKVLVNVGDEVKEGDVLQNDQEGVNPGTIAIVID